MDYIIQFLKSDAAIVAFFITLFLFLLLNKGARDTLVKWKNMYRKKSELLNRIKELEEENILLKASNTELGNNIFNTLIEYNRVVYERDVLNYQLKFAHTSLEGAISELLNKNRDTRAPLLINKLNDVIGGLVTKRVHLNPSEYDLVITTLKEELKRTQDSLSSLITRKSEFEKETYDTYINATKATIGRIEHCMDAMAEFNALANHTIIPDRQPRNSAT